MCQTLRLVENLYPYLLHLGFIFLAFLYPLPAAIARYAAKFHNKFLLLVVSENTILCYTYQFYFTCIFYLYEQHVIMLITLLVLQYLLGGLLYDVSVPTFSYAFQKLCLTNVQFVGLLTIYKTS